MMATVGGIGSLVPFNAQFADASEQGRAAHLRLEHGPRHGGSQEEDFCAAALLCGKDISTIARVLSKQTVEVAGMWNSSRGSRAHTVLKGMASSQRRELLACVLEQVVLVSTADGVVKDGSHGAKLRALTAELQADHITVGDALAQALPLAGSPLLLQAAKLVMKTKVPGGAELPLQCFDHAHGGMDASDEDMCDNAVVTPPDSQNGGSAGSLGATTIGSADAAVSLALTGHHALAGHGPDALIPTKLLRVMQLPSPPPQQMPSPLQQHAPVPMAEPSSVGPTASAEARSSTPPISKRSSRPSTPTRQPASDTPQKVCTNCKTTTTPLWRKEGGVLMCNACGIYFKTHGFHRPVDLIRAASQNRKDSSGGAKSANRTPGGTPQVSGELAGSGLGGGSQLGERDTATSPPHRRRRSSPSPLRWRHSIGEAVSGGGGGRARRPSTGSFHNLPVFNSDAEDALSDGGQSTGGGSVRRSGRRRTSQQAGAYDWYDTEDLAPASRRNSTGCSGGGGSGSHPTGKRSRFADQLHGAAYSSGGYPGMFPSGSDYGGDDEGGATSGSRLAEGHVTAEGGPTLSGTSPYNVRDVHREFSFGPGGYAEGGGVVEGHHPGLPGGLRACTTPRLPSGPLNGDSTEAGTAGVKHEHSGSGGGEQRPTGPSYNGWAGDAAQNQADAVKSNGDAKQNENMDVEETDLTVAHDASQVAAVLLGLKHALVISDGPTAYAGSGRNSPWRNNSPHRSRREDRYQDHGYWSGPDDGGASMPAVKHTKRSRSPAARQRDSARASPAHSSGGADNNKPQQVCANCGTTKTPLWRKDKETGESMCNACGIYKQTHGYARPYRTSQRDASPVRATPPGPVNEPPAAVPSAPAAAPASAAIPIASGRRPSKPTLSSGGAAGNGFVGTPPGTSSALQGAQQSLGHQRRASTGYTPGGKPPLPPPALPRVGPGPPGTTHVQLVPPQAPALGLPASGPPAEPANFTPFAVQQSQSQPTGSNTSFGSPGQATGIPWAPPPVMAPAPAAGMGQPSWPYYTFGMPPQAGAGQVQPPQQQQQQVEQPSGSAEPAQQGATSVPAARPPAHGSPLQSRQSVPQQSVSHQPGLPSQPQPQPGVAMGRPGIGVPIMQQGFNPMPAKAMLPQQQQQQPAGRPYEGEMGQQHSGPAQGMRMPVPVHLGVPPLRPATAGQPMLPQQHQHMAQQPQGPGAPPVAIGVPRDQNHAFAAAASLSRVLQAHQMAVAAAARNSSNSSQPGGEHGAGNPAEQHRQHQYQQQGPPPPHAPQYHMLPAGAMIPGMPAGAMPMYAPIFNMLVQQGPHGAPGQGPPGPMMQAAPGQQANAGMRPQAGMYHLVSTAPFAANSQPVAAQQLHNTKQ